MTVHEEVASGDERRGRSLLVTRVGRARGTEALAAAIATAAADQRSATLLVALAAEARIRRPTLLASPAARELEEQLAASVAGRPVARGLICHLPIGSGEESLDEAAAAVARLPVSAACVVHLPPSLWQPAICHRGLLPRGALLRAELPRDRPLAALAVRDLLRRRLPVRVASRPLGWAAGRRALAGVPVGGSQEPRLRRWADLLLGSAGQAVPGVLGACAALLIAALAVASIAGALTGKGRVQRAADLAALSGARSMRDDLPRLTAPPRLPDGSPNPAHIRKAVYLARAESAALDAGRANGADPHRLEVRFPDARAFPPLRVRVTVFADLEVGGRTRPVGRVAASAVAEAAPPAGGAGDMPAYASGGGYSGPLAYRQGEGMRPDVAAAFDRMTEAARRSGVALVINSGFRSDAEQARLFAAHPDPTWVAPPGKSLHRCATELDLGPSTAYGWLAANARRFGFVHHA